MNGVNNKVKAANDRLAAEWKKEDVIHEYNSLDKKLSNEGGGYDPNKVLNGKTLKEIAEELRIENTANNQVVSTKYDDTSVVPFAGTSTNSDGYE